MEDLQVRHEGGRSDSAPPSDTVPDDSRAKLTRRTLLRAGASGALAFGGATLLASCGAAATKTAPVSASPRRGGTFTAAFISDGPAETVNPALAFNYVDLFRVFALYDALFYPDLKDIAVPYLAEWAEPNADASTWTFRLRKGVVWHDGKPLTADDLLYTIRGWASPTNGSSGLLAPFLDAGAVRKRDNLTVELPLLRPCAEFPSLTSAVNLVVIQDGAKAGDHVGTGPFTYTSFTPGTRSVFTRFPDYWQPGKPYVDTLVIDSSYTDDASRVNALLSGRANLVQNFPFADAREYARSDQITVLNSYGPAPQPFNMIVTDRPFTDNRVRRAMKLIANRPQLIEIVLDGYGTVGNDLAPITSPYFAHQLKIEQDIEQAKALLKAAGYSNLTVQLVTSNAAAGMLEQAVLLKQQAQAAGVTISVDNTPAASYYTAAGGYLHHPFSTSQWLGGFTISITAWCMQVLYSKAPTPETHWGTPETDKLLFDAVGELDPAKAREKWFAFQELQFETGGVISWCNLNNVDGIAKNVHGVVASPAGNFGNLLFTNTWLD